MFILSSFVFADKILTTSVGKFVTMFIACADNIVVATPEYTQTEQDSTYTQPIKETIDTTTYHFCLEVYVQL